MGSCGDVGLSDKGQAVRIDLIFSLRQVKKSTLNPNAKEFNPTKPLLSVVRWDGRAWTWVSVGSLGGTVEQWRALRPRATRLAVLGEHRTRVGRAARAQGFSGSWHVVQGGFEQGSYR